MDLSVKVWKTLWEKNKMLVTSIFSFSRSVFRNWDCSVKSKPFTVQSSVFYNPEGDDF